MSRVLWVALLLLFILFGSTACAEIENRIKVNQCKTITTFSYLESQYFNTPPPRYSYQDLMWEPGERNHLSYKYSGIEGALIRRARGYYNTYVFRSLSERYQAGYEGFNNPNQYAITLQRLADAESDLMGRWWDRPWNESLVPEKGGAPHDKPLVEIGREIDIFRIGDSTFSNEGKIRLGNLAFYFDQRFGKTVFSRIGEGRAVEQDVGVNLMTVGRGWRRGIPRGNLYTGDDFNVNVKTSFTFRLPEFTGKKMSPENMVASASGELYVSFFHKKKEWGRLVVKVRGSPRNGDVEGTALFEVYSF